MVLKHTFWRLQRTRLLGTRFVMVPYTITSIAAFFGTDFFSFSLHTATDLMIKREEKKINPCRVLPCGKCRFLVAPFFCTLQRFDSSWIRRLLNFVCSDKRRSLNSLCRVMLLYAFFDLIQSDKSRRYILNMHLDRIFLEDFKLKGGEDEDH